MHLRGVAKGSSAGGNKAAGPRGGLGLGGFKMPSLLESFNMKFSSFFQSCKFSLQMDEILYLHCAFQRASKGDMQGKANLALFVRCVLESNKSNFKTRAESIEAEFKKLIELPDSARNYKTWGQMLDLMEQNTILKVGKHRDDALKLCEQQFGQSSAAGFSSHSHSHLALEPFEPIIRTSPSLKSKEVRDYRALLETKGIEFAIADRKDVEFAHMHKMQLDEQLHKLDSKDRFPGAKSSSEYDAISDRVHEMMEVAASKELLEESSQAEMDAIFGVGDQDDMDVETKGGEPVVGYAILDPAPLSVPVPVPVPAPGLQSNFLTIQQKVQLRVAPLTPQQRAEAEDILQRNPTDELLTDKYGITMTRKKLSCLRARTWLNDEVINFFMSMLKDRDEALCLLNPTGRKSSHYFNSFFISKLLDTENKKVYTYDAVKRWSKKFDIFTKRRIYFPINISNSHWTHLVLYMEQREIHYYDSMGGNGRMYIEAILRWIKDEARTKKNWEEYDVSDFTLVDHGRDVPQQGNGFDCGVFSCTFALFDTDDLPFDFDQVHMPNFRLRICLDILEGGFSYPITL